MELSLHWQTVYLNVANEIAQASKDGSSKFGAVLVRPDKTVASIGFNGFPRRMNDNERWLTDTSLRHMKYPRIVHAEANCLDHKRDDDTTGYHMVVNAHPCSACALRIANTGIEYVYYKYQPEFEERWAESLAMSKTIFDETGVKLIKIV